MSEVKKSELLVSHDEREQAFEALGAHVRVGRLTVDEYGDRAEGLNTARTRGEVRQLFTDLPEPGPRFENASSQERVSRSTEVAASRQHDVSRPPDGSRYPEVTRHGELLPTRQRLARASVPVGAFTAVGLTYATGNWAFMFLTPPVTFAVESLLRGRRWRRRSR